MQATATAGAVPFTLAAAAKCIACSPPNPCFIYRRSVAKFFTLALRTSGSHAWFGPMALALLLTVSPELGLHWHCKYGKTAFQLRDST
ncbi:uncharacterized protein LOC142564237 isoform X6 [Dermacentor variabilis]|uniref:uncharacterized protein LOC142564237 isoform X6 n=1 Tax=Dermacentor variabilis TaxID=34621 RepID=UPI003F5C1D50